MARQKRLMTFKRFCNLPMVKWEAAHAKLSTDERRIIDDEAASVATQAARLSAYLSRRASGGKHADAVKAQNRAAASVRQALGFTYYGGNLTF